MTVLVPAFQVDPTSRSLRGRPRATAARGCEPETVFVALGPGEQQVLPAAFITLGDNEEPEIGQRLLLEEANRRHVGSGVAMARESLDHRRVWITRRGHPAGPGSERLLAHIFGASLGCDGRSRREWSRSPLRCLPVSVYHDCHPPEAGPVGDALFR